MLKILHLAHDDKFIDMAYNTYEKIFPEQNEVWVYTHKNEFEYIKNKEFRRINKSFLTKRETIKAIESYDCVVIHSLISPFILPILRASSKTKFIWLGWGYDYYDLIHNDSSQLFLPKTSVLREKQIAEKGILYGLYRRLGKLIKKTILKKIKLHAIKKIRVFAPVLPEEYDIVKSRHEMTPFPDYVSWNYGNLEDDLIKGYEELYTNGSNIMVGNSATQTNNHLEAFDFLSAIDLKDRKVIVPLTYGDDKYKTAILKAGEEQLKDNFSPLKTFMPVEEYVGIIRSCDFVVMNHVRQQALCNIVIMMYLGAKIFLREECPTYDYYKQQGALIYSVQELEKDPSLLDHKLSPEEVAKNRQALNIDRSRESILRKTEEIINYVIESKNGG